MLSLLTAGAAAEASPSVCRALPPGVSCPQQVNVSGDHNSIRMICEVKVVCAEIDQLRNDRVLSTLEGNQRVLERLAGKVNELSGIVAQLDQAAGRAEQSRSEDQRRLQWLRTTTTDLQREIPERAAETSKQLEGLRSEIRQTQWQTVRTTGAIVAASALSVDLALWAVSLKIPSACIESSDALYCPPEEHRERARLRLAQTLAGAVMGVGLAAVAIGHLQLAINFPSQQGISCTVTQRF